MLKTTNYKPIIKTQVKRTHKKSACKRNGIAKKYKFFNDSSRSIVKSCTLARKIRRKKSVRKDSPFLGKSESDKPAQPI